MTTPKQPATEDWRGKWDRIGSRQDRLAYLRTHWPDLMDAIEAEAATGLLALRQALERVVGAGGHFGDLVSARNNAARVLADTAEAAAEIEARIRADEREQVTQALYEMGFEIDDDVDDRLTKRLADYDRWRDRDREQPATEEAGE
jgi:hypothetical protein